jgi:uncharacterized membrane protein HdeD (DUF308 family)
MLSVLTRYWWVFLLRGAAAILFGIAAFVWPNVTVAVLVLLFGAYALVDGASLLVTLVRGDPVARRHVWAVGIMGVLGIAAGVIAFVYPNVTALALLYVVAFWAIAIGVFQVVAAIRLRQEIQGELWLALGGVLTVLFGIYLVVFPGAGLLSLVYLLAIWAVIFGVSSLFVGWRLRGLQGMPGMPAPA